jgi:hypothetical protein
MEMNSRLFRFCGGTEAENKSQIQFTQIIVESDKSLPVWADFQPAPRAIRK